MFIGVNIGASYNVWHSLLLVKFGNIAMSVRFGDYALAATILALSVVALCASTQSLRAPAAKALVYSDNTLRQKIDLSVDRSDVALADNPDMILEVRRGRVRVAQADCPRKLCQHAGWISRPGQTIVCLPNRLLIEIAGGNKAPAYDAVSY